MSYHSPGMGGIADVIRNIFGGGEPSARQATAQEAASMKAHSQGTARAGSPDDIGPLVSSLYTGGTQSRAGQAQAAAAKAEAKARQAQAQAAKQRASAFQRRYRSEVVPHLKEIQRRVSILLD